MSSGSLILRSLRHFWRTHLAVVAGVAVAVSVLAGALLVGESVRASLRGLVDERLGRTAVAVTGPGFFRQALSADIKKASGFSTSFADAAAIIAIEGALTHEPSGRQAAKVNVYGVDDDFFRLHGVEVKAPTVRQALLSPDLAAELGAQKDDGLLLRVQKPSAIPADTLVGRRTDTSRAVRLSVRETLDASRMGEFTLRPQQDAIRAVFVPIARLQRDLELPGRANVLLASGPVEAGVQPRVAADLQPRVSALLDEVATFEDLGLRLIPAGRQHALVLESETGLLPDSLVARARAQAQPLGLRDVPVLTYLANTIRAGDREIPYSVIASVDPRRYDGATEVSEPIAATTHPPIWLNDWAADQLKPSVGDEVTLEYYLWSDEGGLTTSSAKLSYVGAVPMTGAGGDRSLTPEYPGLTDAPRMGDWDPPFPVDLKRIRPVDEQYWEDHRAAPKAFITNGPALWASPYGTATSVRLYVPTAMPLESARDAFAAVLRRDYTPTAAGLVVQPVREQALAASRGATNFGEYFTYFSFFIVVSGLLLAGLFFKLGMEQRVREIGLFYAVGFTPGRVRLLLGAEGVLLAGVGAIVGMAGAVAFAAAILYGLRTWWVDAVGTTRLALAVTPSALVFGALGGLVAASVTLLVTLRRLGTSAPRDLLSGLALMASPASKPVRGSAWMRLIVGTVAAIALAAAGALEVIGQTAAFFAAGGVLLVTLLLAASAALRSAPASTLEGHGAAAVARLGIRQATANPGRSVLSIALIAFATFVIVSVGAFRRGAPEDARDVNSGTGGYTLFAESVVPLLFDPGTAEGRRELGLTSSVAAGLQPSSVAAGLQPDSVAAGLQPRVLDATTIMRFRLRPGEDGSCLNLYKPTSPRIIAPARPFVEAGGFRFAASLAETDEERRNPWRLLEKSFPDGAVPVIGDANSLQYVMHVGVGDDILIPGPGGQPVNFRVVASLSDSVFQSELIIGEAQFERLFPRPEGYRFFVMRAPDGRDNDVATALEDGLADYGFDAQSTAARLASYHRVENTYLSTFQALGGLGLLIGTLGLGAILLRNVLERRRELALLQAVGYQGGTLGWMVVAESVALMVAGIGAGTLSAVLAVAPALASRATSLPITSTLVVLAAVFAAGLVASVIATRAAAASPLLASLKAD
jgi:putative ABC transport system permease protein